MKDYSKPPLSYDKQLDLFESRGLLIDNREYAKAFLSHVSYYRFSGYCIPFEFERHKFKPGVKFDYIRELYEFDREFRFVISEGLEIIENSMRAAVAYHLAHKYGVFAHEERSTFHNFDNYSEWIDKIHQETKRSKEIFVEHYKSTYKGFPKLPLWMALEVMSFGSLSKLFYNLKREDQLLIAKSFGIHSRVLISWLHVFSYVRNICAHHGRLWNRKRTIKMRKPKKDRYWKKVRPDKMGAVVFALNKFLNSLQYSKKINCNWRTKIERLLTLDMHVDNFYA